MAKAPHSKKEPGTTLSDLEREKESKFAAIGKLEVEIASLRNREENDTFKKSILWDEITKKEKASKKLVQEYIKIIADLQKKKLAAGEDNSIPDDVTVIRDNCSPANSANKGKVASALDDDGQTLSTAPSSGSDGSDLITRIASFEEGVEVTIEEPAVCEKEAAPNTMENPGSDGSEELEVPKRIEVSKGGEEKSSLLSKVKRFFSRVKNKLNGNAINSERSGSDSSSIYVPKNPKKGHKRRISNITGEEVGRHSARYIRNKNVPETLEQYIKMRKKNRSSLINNLRSPWEERYKLETIESFYENAYELGGYLYSEFKKGFENIDPLSENDLKLFKFAYDKLMSKKKDEQNSDDFLSKFSDCDEEYFMPTTKEVIEVIIPGLHLSIEEIGQVAINELVQSTKVKRVHESGEFIMKLYERTGFCMKMLETEHSLTSEERIELIEALYSDVAYLLFDQNPGLGKCRHTFSDPIYPEFYTTLRKKQLNGHNKNKGGSHETPTPSPLSNGRKLM